MTGANWEFVEYTTSLNDVPPLWNHSMAWDPSGRRLIVTGGFMDSAHAKPNGNTWYVTFFQFDRSVAGHLDAGVCRVPIPLRVRRRIRVVREGARGGLRPGRTGDGILGGELAGGESSYGNTVECR